MSNMTRLYCRSITASRKYQLEQKVIAERLFKGKKSSYSARVGELFSDFTPGLTACP